VTPEDSATVHEIAYAEAVRAMSEQVGVIDSFRARAGLLLSSAAVTTSFLASQALRGGETRAVAWLALLAFGGVATLSLAILWPRRWEFTVRSGALSRADDGAERAVTPAELYRSMSSHLDRSQEENRGTLNNLALLFELASSLLAIEVILWIVAIATGP
jgi:hypothetical protein